MTRLKKSDVFDIGSGLQTYDAYLKAQTGRGLRGIACHAGKIDPKALARPIKTARIGIIPMTCGQGVISGFSDAVAGICAHLGFNTFITAHTDAAGMAEAFEKQTDIVMMADEHRFIALNVKKCRVIDNAVATARGFTGGLDLMTGGLSGKKCLVIGCGPVGQAAAVALLGFGAVVSVYDRDRQRSMALCKAMAHEQTVPAIVEKSLESALETHRILFDATNSGGFITEEMITPDTFIAAPGMPLGLSSTACIKIGDRLLHDPLQTGVACMAVSATTL
jgi:pyrrolysine biosynthesis protein PylD